MQYESPQSVDFDEVRGLNMAFLTTLRRFGNNARLLAGVPETISLRLNALDTTQSERLASTPFLLFTLRESDESYWEQVHRKQRSYDLFDAGAHGDHEVGRLVDAALAYAWQMARRNPYTLRLVACASLYWCERLAEQRLVEVIHRAAALDNVLELRAADNTLLWERLLTGGIDARKDIRRATHQSVLQTLLICPNARRSRRFRSAACKTRIPALATVRDD